MSPKGITKRKDQERFFVVEHSSDELTILGSIGRLRMSIKAPLAGSPSLYVSERSEAVEAQICSSIVSRAFYREWRGR